MLPPGGIEIMSHKQYSSIICGNLNREKMEEAQSTQGSRHTLPTSPTLGRCFFERLKNEKEKTYIYKEVC